MSSWKSISYTNVVYIEGDMVGYILAWCSLIPLFIIISFLTLIIFKRDLLTICYFVGILINEIINCTLKFSIKEKRPHTHGSGYGMPSSHSQFMTFFTIFLALHLFLGKQKKSQHFSLNIWQFIYITGSIIMSACIFISRVYLKYHTTTQVLCGILVGFTIGSIWFAAVYFFISPYFSDIVSWQISKILLIRDCSEIPNILQFEYDCVLAETSRIALKNNRRRKSE